jgi:hypothetical protein
LFIKSISSPPDEGISSTTLDGANFRPAAPFHLPVLNNSEVANRMKSLFETSLKLHLTGEYMEVPRTGFHIFLPLTF